MTAERRQAIRSALFLGAFLAVLVWPLRNGLPALKDALPPPSGTFSKIPIAAAARDAVFLPVEYMRRYEAHYEGRVRRVEIYNAVMLNALDVHVFPTVLRGRDDWLFWTGEGNINDYQNVQPFSRADLEELEQKLAATQARMAEEGIVFLLVPAPNKETIYPEMLPPGIAKIGPASRLDQLLVYLKERHNPVSLLDLRPVLLAEKAQGLLYYRTDTHWNDLGAYTASAAMMATLQEDFPALQMPGLETYRRESETISGDLARLLLTEPLLSETTERLIPAAPPSVRFVEKTDRVITISEVDDASLPRAVIFRDSFANSLEPFLAGHFSRAVYPWTFGIDWELIEREQPDIVIYELAERYLHYMKEITPE
ncbi:MAG: hypothetical protein IT308_02980 [Anaerolineaceae bacterium]|nr:hypothetical protein [Anaerolineaceae bacterium]